MFQSKLMQADGTLICIIDNKVYNVTNEHQQYDMLLTAFKDGDSDTFVQNVDINTSIENIVNGTEVAHDLVLKDDTLYYKGDVLPLLFNETLLKQINEGFDIVPMVNFLSNLYDNPSKRAVDEGFTFLNVCGLSITEDGCFLAYKTVRENYTDKYSGQVDNNVGAVVSMARNKVDDDASNTCSYGFHVGALDYAGPGGWYNNESDNVLIVKINPKHIVSVPKDHSCQKMRVCCYEVVGEFQGKLTRAVYSGDVKGDYTSNKQCSWLQAFDKNIQPEQMLIDKYYTGYIDGEISYMLVLERNDNCVIVEFVEPDTCAGDTCELSLKQLLNVRCWDGVSEVSCYYDKESNDNNDEDDDVDDNFNDDIDFKGFWPKS